MNKTEANKEAKKIYDKWCKDKQKIEKENKENGTWRTGGLDSNNHLFKELDNEVKEKLEMLKSIIED